MYEINFLKIELYQAKTIIVTAPSSTEFPSKCCMLWFFSVCWPRYTLCPCSLCLTNKLLELYSIWNNINFIFCYEKLIVAWKFITILFVTYIEMSLSMQQQFKSQFTFSKFFICDYYSFLSVFFFTHKDNWISLWF